MGQTATWSSTTTPLGPEQSLRHPWPLLIAQDIPADGDDAPPPPPPAGQPPRNVMQPPPPPPPATGDRHMDIRSASAFGELGCSFSVDADAPPALVIRAVKQLPISCALHELFAGAKCFAHGRQRGPNGRSLGPAQAAHESEQCVRHEWALLTAQDLPDDGDDAPPPPPPAGQPPRNATQPPPPPPLASGDASLPPRRWRTEPRAVAKAKAAPRAQAAPRFVEDRPRSPTLFSSA